MKAIRTQVLSILGITAILGTLYVLFLLDTHLKFAFSYGLGAGNGAEVNIASLKTRLTVPSLTIEGIEVTNPAAPLKNRVSIGKVELKLLWDALLRGKVVIDRVAVLNLGLNTDRRSRGWVAPPVKPDPNSISGKLSASLGRSVDSSLARATSLLGGFNPLKNLGSIDPKHANESLARLKADLETQKQKWQAAVGALPSSQSLGELSGKVSAVQGGQLAALPGLIAEAQTKVTAVTDGSATIQGGLSSFDAGLKSVDQAVAKDRSDIEAKLSLPKLDSSSLAQDLMRGPVEQELARQGPMIEKISPYLKRSGAKVEEKSAAPPARPRGGRVFEFGRPNSYPAFWLKLAEFSGEAEASLTGKITDVTSDPRALGRPTLVDLKGELPRQGIGGLYLRGEIDARGPFKASFAAGAARAALPDMTVLESPDLGLGLRELESGLRLQATYAAQAIDLTARLEANRFEPVLSGASAIGVKVLGEALRSVKPLYGELRVRGSLESPSLALETNLASALEKGLGAYLAKELDRARKEIEAKLGAELNAKRAALTKDFEGEKARLLGELAARKSQAEGIVRAGESKLREATAAADAVKNRAAEELKKRLPF